MTIGTAFFIAGVAQFLAGWMFFRHLGQRFWVVAPIWQASRFLSPAGVALWVGGMALMFVGVAAMYSAMLLF